jgi:DNA-binding MarR family transcriptional regulator
VFGVPCGFEFADAEHYVRGLAATSVIVGCPPVCGDSIEKLYSFNWTVQPGEFTVDDVPEVVETLSESAVRATHELRTVVGRLRRRLRETYSTEGLTPSQTSALIRLQQDGPASISDLAAGERVRHQSMTATLGALEARGFIARRADPTDGRRQLMSVTDSGRAFLDDRRRANEEWLSSALQSHFSEQERQVVLQALSLLDRLTHL